MSKARFIVERRLPQPTSEMPQNVSLNFGNNLSQTRTSHAHVIEFPSPVESEDMSGNENMWPRVFVGDPTSRPTLSF